LRTDGQRLDPLILAIGAGVCRNVLHSIEINILGWTDNGHKEGEQRCASKRCKFLEHGEISYGLNLTGAK
jgi:hypothetical protein